ncbi:AP-1 complex-associated regulatory protein isoform X2 [Falco rusticolus]|uniref:AP-1 complex-associated regulatory protein isoform X2 n=1 Tax=Falco rusticolus TaxID=120794 RepID=UPI000FFB6D59|nr:AP-1 complex-associated regulatory protein isoform X2 [Falco rusticolus]
MPLKGCSALCVWRVDGNTLPGMAWVNRLRGCSYSFSPLPGLFFWKKWLRRVFHVSCPNLCRLPCLCEGGETPYFLEYDQSEAETVGIKRDYYRRSKYFRTCSTGEHFTIEFENLVESDEGDSPGSSHRPLTEEEIADLKDRHYDSIAEKQRAVDLKLQSEQRRQQRITQRAHAANNGEHQSSVAEEDFDSFLRNTKFHYEAFRSSRLSSDATVLTPNTESSCDLMTKTKSMSGNDDSTSLDLEWEDEEGINRLIPMRERSKTEEDILRAALKCNSKKTGSNPASASDDSNGLEWENDFVSAEMDDNGNSEYAGFVNPVLDLSASDVRISDSDRQDR